MPNAEVRRDPFQQLIVGNSLPMRLLYNLMETAAKTSVTVLVQGETGTGKELVAKGIHLASARAKGPFVPINCAALPEPLLESLLFGHRQGAFTGADHDQPGAFRTAHEGTMLLDEIGDMPLGLQAKLLRVLQDGEIVPIGEQKPERVDVRVIAATNHDLLRAVPKTFRPDLYYRLAVLVMTVPPLRARVPDIAALASVFLARYCDLWDRRHRNTLGGEAIKALMAYPWPGNVRELENEIARAVAVAGDGVMVCKEQLAPHIRRGGTMPMPDLDPIVDVVMSGRFSFDQALNQVERALIERAMAQAGGVMSHAAELLGTSRRRLAYSLFHRTGDVDLLTTVSDVEWRLISEALGETAGNRAAAARILGIKRTTLVAKIKRYSETHPEFLVPKPVETSVGTPGVPGDDRSSLAATSVVGFSAPREPSRT